MEDVDKYEVIHTWKYNIPLNVDNLIKHAKKEGENK